ncbi:uncharacterized protein F4822DRAFT_432779 [Hypoxylon trugodes]|uniref:uncharacterized protein n=1 Tax=Hypoxylon trugodes TaxID=326681 RepID=UPI0021977545|nr:uncharacterized protein F4822DRAFT_432779 [Hypoxylon trugodes]KAI1385919.1 hypothetical protein F4822DRAFT_432779 [Hypoxylon trugodes]
MAGPAAAQFSSINELLLMLVPYILFSQESDTAPRPPAQKGRKTLHSLCLVSHHFNALFTRYLWTSISFEHHDGTSNMSEDIMRSMIESKNLHFTRELQVHATMEGEAATRSTEGLLAFMPNLEFFSWKSAWHHINMNTFCIFSRCCPKLEVLKCQDKLRRESDKRFPPMLEDFGPFPCLKTIVYDDLPRILCWPIFSNAPLLELVVLHFHDWIPADWTRARNTFSRGVDPLPRLILIEYGDLQDGPHLGGCQCAMCSVDVRSTLRFSSVDVYIRERIKEREILYEVPGDRGRWVLICESPAMYKGGNITIANSFKGYWADRLGHVPEFGSIQARISQFG